MNTLVQLVMKLFCCEASLCTMTFSGEVNVQLADIVESPYSITTIPNVHPLLTRGANAPLVITNEA